MQFLAREALQSLTRERLIPVVLGTLIFSILYASPVQRMGDSKYSLLVTQSLLENGRFYLDDYNWRGARSPVFTNPVSIRKALPYQLERNRRRTYYFFPPGSSILSLPFVGVAMLLDHSPALSGQYSEKRERSLQNIVASMLMGMMGMVIYKAARTMLSVRLSILISFGGTLGTMVWSIASRSLPSHTWGIFLLMFLIWELLKNCRSHDRLSIFKQAIYATVLSWAYFVRPTFAISIVGITFYEMWRTRRIPVTLILVGAGWLVLFVMYSRALYDQWLPNYYLPGRVNFVFDQTFWRAFLGALFSPSRGLVIFVPTILGILYLCLRYIKFVPSLPLVILSLSVVLLHLIMISSFRQWWGGNTFGPRLFTDVLPWFFLLTIYGLKAWTQASFDSASAWKRAEIFVLAIFLGIAVFINGIGACNYRVWRWNEERAVDEYPEKLWDWKDPQFLAFNK